MFKHYFIVSFPRTATTGLYVKLCEKLKMKLNSKCLCIYEPFNYNVLEDIFKKGKHVHDRVGKVPHDYNRLPDRLRKLIYENSKWSLVWGGRKENFLGCWFEVIEELRNLGKTVVLKDVYLWVKLKTLCEKYSDTLFIITVREPQYVYNSFLRWFKNRTLTSQVAKKLTVVKEKPLKLLNIYKVVVNVKEVLKKRRTIAPRHLLGLGDFYRYFYGENSLQFKFFTSEKLLKTVFTEVYNVFLHEVSKLKHRNNVHIVEFKKTLNVEQVLDNILRTTHSKPTTVEGTLKT